MPSFLSCKSTREGKRTDVNRCAGEEKEAGDEERGKGAGRERLSNGNRHVSSLISFLGGASSTRLDAFFDLWLKMTETIAPRHKSPRADREMGITRECGGG